MAVPGQDLGLPKEVLLARDKVPTLIVRDAQGKDIATGTGFITEKGQLLTNWHVIDGGHHVCAVYSSGQSITTETVAGADFQNDLALLAISSKDEPNLGSSIRLRVARELPKVGSRVYVIGSPRGLQGTVSEGIVSAVRDLDSIGRRIQFTAAVSPGSSGSPLLDSSGMVVGIVSSSLTDSQLLNFAIPATLVEPISTTQPQPLSRMHGQGLAVSPAGGSAAKQDSAVNVLRHLICTRARSLLEEQDQARQRVALQTLSTQSFDQIEKTAEQRATLEAEVNRLCDSQSITLHSIETKFGWPEDQPWIALTVYLYLHLSDADKKALNDACVALICSDQSNEAAWELLAFISSITLSSEYAGRAAFELARLRPSNWTDRYGFLATYYADSRVLCPLALCDSDWTKIGVDAILAHRETDQPDPLTIMYQLADPDECITLLDLMTKFEPAWKGNAEFCRVLSRTYLRKAEMSAVSVASGVHDKGSPHGVQFVIDGLEWTLREYLDAENGKLDHLIVQNEWLEKATQALGQCIELARKKGESQISRGELAALVSGPSEHDFEQLAMLHFLLGDKGAAVAAQREAVALVAARLDVSLSSHLNHQDQYSLGHVLDAWNATVRARCVLVRLRWRNGNTEDAKQSLVELDSELNHFKSSLRTADRDSPSFGAENTEVMKYVERARVEIR